jgi:hypothetical protein
LVDIHDPPVGVPEVGLAVGVDEDRIGASP